MVYKIDDTKLAMRSRKSKTHRQIIQKPTEERQLMMYNAYCSFYFGYCLSFFTLRRNQSDTRIVHRHHGFHRLGIVLGH